MPGVRLNLSKTGVGASFGSGPVRYSVHSSGRRTVSARTGIPGVTYQQSVRQSGRTQTPVAAPLPTFPAKPGLFAPSSEKELYKACIAQDARAIDAAGTAHPDVRLPAYAMAGLLYASSDADRARRVLRSAFDAGDPAGHPFTQKYLSALRVLVPIAEGVTARQAIDRDAVGLTLAELLQAADEISQAIDVVEQLEPSFVAALSLAELYSLAGRHEDVIDLTNGVQNEDDASALLLAYRGRAFRVEGLHDAAHEALKEALKSRSRMPEVRHLALSERAANYAAQGKKAMARKDLERILGEDSAYPGVVDALAKLGD
jgi:tetratricopeptide (TPR) repeat protein